MSVSDLRLNLPPERATFTWEAGRLIHGQVRRAIQRGAWQHGLEVSFEESKGWLECIGRATFVGEGAGEYAQLVSAWFQRLNEDEL